MDQSARDTASEAKHGLANHIQVTDIKLVNLDKKVDAHHDDHTSRFDRLESILKWAGGLIVMLFLSTLTWSLTQQWNANETAKKDMAQQIELLRSQEAARVQRSQEILSRLPPDTRAAQTPVPTDRDR